MFASEFSFTGTAGTANCVMHQGNHWWCWDSSNTNSLPATAGNIDTNPPPPPLEQESCMGLLAFGQRALTNLKTFLREEH
jgi:hypothetical protein